eukprot:jgi/Bigna1/77222/fgenesh1_pg.46_\
MGPKSDGFRALLSLVGVGLFAAAPLTTVEQEEYGSGALEAKYRWWKIRSSDRVVSRVAVFDVMFPNTTSALSAVRGMSEHFRALDESKSSTRGRDDGNATMEGWRLECGKYLYKDRQYCYQSSREGLYPTWLHAVVAKRFHQSAPGSLHNSEDQRKHNLDGGDNFAFRDMQRLRVSLEAGSCTLFLSQTSALSRQQRRHNGAASSHAISKTSRDSSLKITKLSESHPESEILTLQGEKRSTADSYSWNIASNKEEEEEEAQKKHKYRKKTGPSSSSRSSFLESESGLSTLLRDPIFLWADPPIVCAATDVILNFWATDMLRTFIDYITGAGIAEIGNDSAQAIAAHIMPKITKDIKKKLPKLIYKPLSKQLTKSIQKNLTENIARDIIEPLSRSLSPILTNRISRDLGVTARLSRSLTQAIVPTLTHTLTYHHQASRPAAAAMCQVCYWEGRQCSKCSMSPENMYYQLYYSVYYSEYYSEYYGTYYTTAIQKADEAENKAK